MACRLSSVIIAQDSLDPRFRHCSTAVFAGARNEASVIRQQTAGSELYPAVQGAGTAPFTPLSFDAPVTSTAL
jgi:hypothetical protein